MKFIKNLFVLSSPSGGGKSTVARYLLKEIPTLEFSISATTRPIRPKEVDGRDYYFLTKEEFIKKIENDELIEYEQIFDNYYGTLRSEVQRVINKNGALIFDVDVKGAMSIKRHFPNESILIFLSPPSVYELEKRLRRRSTETNDQIKTRLDRANMEMSFKNRFDFLVINENLEQTLNDSKRILQKFINQD